MRKTWLLVLMLTACSRETKIELKPFEFSQLAWIIGEWKIEKPGSTMIEIWIKENDSTLSGTSYRVTAIDTLLLEKMAIEQRRQAVVFTAIVEGNLGAIPFTMAQYSDREILFENLAHDFPQRIMYTKHGADTLLARIEGIEHGETKLGEYIFIKSK